MREYFSISQNLSQLFPPDKKFKSCFSNLRTLLSEEKCHYIFCTKNIHLIKSISKIYYWSFKRYLLISKFNKIQYISFGEKNLRSRENAHFSETRSKLISNISSTSLDRERRGMRATKICKTITIITLAIMIHNL